MINQTDLKYFMELAKTLNVSRAAERLGISQPTLSHCLKRIETEAKVPLFTRSKKGVSLTAAGQRLFEQAEELILKWEQVLQSANNEVQKISGLLKVGCHTAVAKYIFPLFVGEFLKQNTDINFQFSHGLSRHLTEDVISQKIDFAIVVNPVAHLDLIIKEVMKDRVTLWKSKKCLNADVLIVDPDLLQTQDLLQKLKRKNIHFKRVIESSSLEVIAQLVSDGAGCGILPERVIKSYGDNTVLQVKDAPEFQDRICMIYKNEFRKSARGQTLIHAVTNI